MAGVLLVLGAVGFTISQFRISGVEHTVTGINNGVAVRCVQGDDRACDRLRNRLMETASRKELREIVQVLNAGK